MALVIADRVKAQTTTTGTGAYTIGATASGFQGFDAIGDGNTTYYAVTDNSTNYEVGLGTYTASGGTLARTAVLESSNSDAAVDWGAGDKDIFVTVPAAKFLYKDNNANVDIGSGSLTVGSHIDLDIQSAHAAHNEGRLWYDSIHKTLNYYSDDVNVVHELGIEEHQRVYNNTGSTIGKGKPLYFSGNYVSGDIDVPTVGLANATDVNAYNAQGLAASDIADGAYGYCIIAGQLTGLDTSALTAGTNFFVGLTAGAVQNASPVYPNYPMCLGWVVNSDASNGILLVNQQNHSVNSFRVRTSAHIGSDLTVDGDLNVVGTTTSTSSNNVVAGAPFYRANEGDSIGEAGTTFNGSGLDDAFFSGHFTGTTSTTYYVKIDGTGGAADTFAVSTDNFATTQSSGTAITGDKQLIHSADNIYVEFGATTGHTLNDVWTGTAGPTNVDTGFWSNRNTGTSGVGYTHVGLFFDVTDAKWKLTDEYDPVPQGAIDTSHSSYSTATIVANVEGNVTGAVTGNATTASTLQTSRNIALTGPVTGTASFNGGADASIATTLTASDVLTAVKSVDGTGSGLDSDTLDGQEGSYYLDGNNFTNLPSGGVTFSDLLYDSWTNSGTTSAYNAGYYGFAAMDANTWPCMYCQISTYTVTISSDGATGNAYRFRKVYRTYS
tara:strand:- start:9615 stop:11606 length:1992 start_codon:yes stop_codon:yes gene_type:complete